MKFFINPFKPVVLEGSMTCRIVRKFAFKKEEILVKNSDGSSFNRSYAFLENYYAIQKSYVLHEKFCDEVVYGYNNLCSCNADLVWKDVERFFTHDKESAYAKFRSYQK